MSQVVGFQGTRSLILLTCLYFLLNVPHFLIAHLPFSAGGVLRASAAAHILFDGHKALSWLLYTSDWAAAGIGLKPRARSVVFLNGSPILSSIGSEPSLGPGPKDKLPKLS